MTNPLPTALESWRPPTADMLRSFVFLFVLCALAIALKSPDALSDPQFYAEDGPVFFGTQQGHLLPQWFATYSGYLHIVPRTIAWLGSLVPLALAPTVYNGCAWLIDAGCVAYLLFRLSKYRLAAAACFAIFLTPTNGEVYGTATNVQWFGQLLLIAACFFPSSPRRRAHDAILAIAVLAFSLSGPFSVLLAAIHASMLCVRGLTGNRLTDVDAPWRGENRLALSALWVGAAVQAFCIATATDSGIHSGSVQFTLQSLGSFTQGHLFGTQIIPASMFLLLILAMALRLLFVRECGAGLPLLAMFLLAVGEIVVASGKQNAIGAAVGYSDRYFFLFNIAFWLAAYAIVRASAARHGKHLTQILAASFLLVALTHGQVLQRRPLEDKHWAAAVNAIPAGKKARVPINPTPWGVAVEKKP